MREREQMRPLIAPSIGFPIYEPRSQIDSVKKCLQTACKRLGHPQFTHHDFRHFFATTCIEAGVAMRAYGHLREEPSFSMVKQVTF
jgi:integrase